MEEEKVTGWTIINNDGSERKLSREETDSFFTMIQDAAKRLEQRDGGEAWKAAREELNATVPDLHLDQLGGYTPIQGYGTYQGEECYFRARYQHATFSVGTYGKDPADWLVKIAVKIPGCRVIQKWDDIVWKKEEAFWLRKLAVRIPGLRKTAYVSGWEAKRQASMQVVPCDDPYGAGYLTPAQCVVIIRDALIPNLRKRTRNDGKQELKAMSDHIDALKHATRKMEGGADGLSTSIH